MEKTVILDSRSCYLRAVRLLSMREYSEKKLYTKLEQIGYSETQIEEAFVELRAKDYLQDERFKEMKCRQLLRSGSGPGQIFNKLRENGMTVKKEELEAYRDDLGINLDEQIEKIIEQKLSSSAFKKIEDDYKCVSKLYQQLSSKGYRVPLDKIKAMVKNRGNLT